MQIELIAPATDESAPLPRMGLGILAALTPREDEVIYTDDVVRPFDIRRDVKAVDLVGISADSKTAEHRRAVYKRPLKAAAAVGGARIARWRCRRRLRRRRDGAPS